MTGVWAQPARSHKRHYFPVEGQPSACGKWSNNGTLPDRGRAKCEECKAGAQ